MEPAPSAITDVLGGTVAWRSAGADDAPLAVFFHGLGGDRYSWDPQLSALSTRRHCCAWDLPGYGDSPGLPGSLPQLAALAAEWIIGLGGPADVVGLSFGGMLAQHLALDHPHVVRSLTLLDTSPAFGLDGTTDPDEWLAARVTPLRDFDRTERARAVVASLVGPDCPEDVRSQVVRSMRAISTESLAATCRSLIGHDTRQRLGQIAAPTLVMVGAEDTETPRSYAESISIAVPGARLVVVPGAGHILNLEAPEAVNAALIRHWASSEGSRA